MITLFTVLVKYKDSDEASYEVRKERLIEVVTRVSEIDNLECIKIVPKKIEPSLENNFKT